MFLMLSRARIIQIISKATIKVDISGMYKNWDKFHALCFRLYWNSLQSLVTDFKVPLSVFILCLSVLYIIVLFPHFCLETLFPLIMHDSASPWCFLDFSVNVFFCLFVSSFYSLSPTFVIGKSLLIFCFSCIYFSYLSCTFMASTFLLVRSIFWLLKLF